MKTTSANITARSSQRAFTLAELMAATAVGLALSGTVVLLLVQTTTEQRSGFAETTVEEKAYTLEAKLTTCLRGMSANNGLTINNSSGFYTSNGTLLGYQSIYMFVPTNGSYNIANISYNSASGQVIYVPNVATPSTQFLWMTNSSTAMLTEFYFTTSYNLDGSQNNSLVNVVFQMNDNGFSQQNPTNNPASIFRNFSVQMRNDN